MVDFEDLLRNKKIIVGIVFIVLLILLSYLCFSMFFGKEKCPTEYCFKESMKDCKKAFFSNLQEQTLWTYEVKGAQAGTCKIIVKVEEVQKETASTKSLEGKEMECYIPKGVIAMPEEKIEYCHGLLKEAIQDQIIERMHLYIVQKIGQIEKTISGNNTGNMTNSTADITGSIIQEII